MRRIPPDVAYARLKRIVAARLRGESLSSIARAEGVSKERVRQLCSISQRFHPELRAKGVSLTFDRMARDPDPS